MFNPSLQIDRLLALLLIAGLALPSPALALRAQQSPSVRAGLEEALTSGDPDAPLSAIEGIDLSAYRRVAGGDQSDIYKRPGEEQVVRVFRDERVRDDAVRRYLGIIQELSSELSLFERPVRLPVMELVRIKGRPAGRELALRTAEVKGITLKEFSRKFITPGRTWFERFLASSPDPQRWLLKYLKSRVAWHLTQIDVRTGGLADRHYQWSEGETGAQLEFSLDSTLDNFIVPEQFVQQIEPRGLFFFGGVRFRDEVAGRAYVVHVDPLNINAVMEQTGLEEQERPVAQRWSEQESIEKRDKVLPLFSQEGTLSDSFGYQLAPESLKVYRYAGGGRRDDFIAAYGAEKWSLPSTRSGFPAYPNERAVFVRVGALFFVDLDEFGFLEGKRQEAIRKILGGNMLLVPKLQDSTVANIFDREKGVFGMYTYATIAAMLQTDRFPERMVIAGVGNGDLLLALGALGVQYLEGFDLREDMVLQANEKLKANGFKEINVFVGDLTWPQELFSRLIFNGRETGFVANIGTWPDLYHVTNQSLIPLIGRVSQDSPVTLFFGAGYFIGREKTEVPKALLEDQPIFQNEGFSPSRLVTSLGLISNNYALTWSATRGVGPQLENHSGLEEKPGELDEIGQKAQLMIIQRLIGRRKEAFRRGQLRQRQRAREPQTTAVPVGSTLASPAAPEPWFNPRRWVEQIEAREDDLWKSGTVRIPMGNREMVVFFREGKQGLLVDLFVFVQATGEHLYLGRCDLARFGNPMEAYVAQGAGHYATDFRPIALNYMGWHRIILPEDVGDIKRYRLDHNTEALYVHEENLQRLGLEKEMISDALLFCIAWMADTPWFGVDTLYSNPHLAELLKESRLEILSNGAYRFFKRGETVDLLRRRLRQQAPPAFPQGLRDSLWLAINPKMMEEILSAGIGRVSVPGGEAVFLTRPRGVGYPYLMIDLILIPSGVKPVYAGRVDFFPTREVAFVEGAGPPLEFSKAGMDFLRDQSIPDSGNSSPFEKARDVSHRSAALYVDSGELKELGLDWMEMERGLALAAMEALRNGTVKEVELGEGFQNQFFWGLCSALGHNPPKDPRMEVGRAGDLLRKQLAASASGSKVSPEEVEVAQKRVDAATMALTAGRPADRPLRWQVVSPSVAAKYPALSHLDSFTFPGVRVDPGGYGSELLAQELETAGVHEATYYGSEGEHRAFDEVASRWKISSTRIPPGALSFKVFLQQLLENLTALSAAQMGARGVDLQRLAADLELLEKA